MRVPSTRRPRRQAPSESLRPSLLAVLVLLLAAPAAAQEKRALSLDDYGAWSRIRAATLSPDGAWMTYGYAPNEGDGTFHVRELDDGTLHTAVNGTSPAFSGDSRWVGFLTTPPESEAGKLREQNGPVPRALETIDLRDGSRRIEDDVDSWGFSDDSRFLAIRKRPLDREAEHEGSDLLLRDLTTGLTRNIGNVSSFAFNDEGTHLAYLVDAVGASGNGLYVVELRTGRTLPLSTGPHRYAQLSWSDDGTALAVLRGDAVSGMEERRNILLAFRDLDPTLVDNGDGSFRYDPAEDPDFPEGMVVSDRASLDWSEDGERIFLGIKDQRPEAPSVDEPEADVDVWHWADEEVQSRQIIQSDMDRRFTFRSVVDLRNGRFVPLADREMRGIVETSHPRWVIGRMDALYRGDVAAPGGRVDLYRVSTTTGARTLLVDEVRYSLGPSPDGRWHLYFRRGHFIAQELETGRRRNLSAAVPVSFVNEAMDRPTEKGPYGLAGWSEDGSSIIVNHRFDLWRLFLDGSDPVNLTGGRGEAEQIRFRLERLDPEEETVDLERALVLSAYGEWTKKSGYYELRPDGTLTPLLFEDRMVGSLTRARDAERVMFTRQTFTEFPDFHVSSSVRNLRNSRRVTEANPQLAEFRWGRRVLVDYENARGDRLQATLTLPEGYREGRRYPMIVYFYEKMSQRHHEFSFPTFDDRPHMSTYASNGYLVLMPDIVYDEGLPGSSALDDVTSATRRAVEMGYADPDRIGLQGHSWGGYQSSFIVTQTDLFAAVVTGAPLTNLVSMHNAIYAASGNFNGPLIQWGQGRMGVSPWEDFALYESQSPVYQAEGITSPLLILHGTEDGAVDWLQGIEFYQTARRLGKNVILLSYPGEPHHLARKENQIDFQIRMKQYFDHYLKAAPAPRWIREGVPHLDKGREVDVQWELPEPSWP